MSVRYFHGGPKGRQRGGFILPPNLTRAKTLANYGAGGVCRTDRVYVTTDLRAALLYAAGVPKGVIYEVKPVGELEPDPDCLEPGLSFQCESAKVVRVIKPRPNEIEMARHALMM